MKKGKMVHPKKVCSLSGNSNKMRYPEEIPKTYRRKGIRQKRTKEGRRHEGKTAAGRRQQERSFAHQNRIITIPSLADKQDLEIDTDQERGGKIGFWNENNTN